MVVASGVNTMTLTVATGQPNSQLLIHLDKKSSLNPMFSQITNPVTIKRTMKLVTAGPINLVINFIYNIYSIGLKGKSTTCRLIAKDQSCFSNIRPFFCFFGSVYKI